MGIGNTAKVHEAAAGAIQDLFITADNRVIVAAARFIQDLCITADNWVIVATAVAIPPLVDLLGPGPPPSEWHVGSREFIIRVRSRTARESLAMVLMTQDRGQEALKSSLMNP